jgi:hypothetical protein
VPSEDVAAPGKTFYEFFHDSTGTCYSFTVGVRVVKVPAVTVESDMDVQESAELRFSCMYGNI